MNNYQQFSVVGAQDLVGGWVDQTGEVWSTSSALLRSSVFTLSAIRSHRSVLSKGNIHYVYIHKSVRGWEESSGVEVTGGRKTS